MRPGDPSPKLRNQMYEICDWRCEYCGTPVSDLHHIPFRSQDGSNNDPDHLIGLCRRHHDWIHRGSSDKSAYFNFMHWYKNLPVHHLQMWREDRREEVTNFIQQ